MRVRKVKFLKCLKVCFEIQVFPPEHVGSSWYDKSGSCHISSTSCYVTHSCCQS